MGRSPGRTGRRAGPPATGRGASAPWSRARRPGGPNRAALRPSTGAPRERGRRRTSFSTDRPRRSAAPAEGSRPGRPASAAPTRPPAGSRGRSRGFARAGKCARCSGASFVDFHPWYPPFLGIPRKQAVRAFGEAPVAHTQGVVEARPVVLPGYRGGQLHQLRLVEAPAQLSEQAVRDSRRCPGHPHRVLENQLLQGGEGGAVAVAGKCSELVVRDPQFLSQHRADVRAELAADDERHLHLGELLEAGVHQIGAVERELHGAHTEEHPAVVRRRPHRLGDLAKATPGEPVREALQQTRVLLRYTKNPGHSVLLSRAFGGAPRTRRRRTSPDPSRRGRTQRCLRSRPSARPSRPILWQSRLLLSVPDSPGIRQGGRAYAGRSTAKSRVSRLSLCAGTLPNGCGRTCSRGTSARRRAWHEPSCRVTGTPGTSSAFASPPGTPPRSDTGSIAGSRRRPERRR